jgi:hypothetical protein
MPGVDLNNPAPPSPTTRLPTGGVALGAHKVIGAKVNILRVLFGILFGVFMEYSS